MKKIVAILFAVLLTVGLVACGGEDSSFDGNQTAVGGTTEAKATYSTYDDLKMYEEIGLETYFNYPLWECDLEGNGYIISDSNDYFLAVAFDTEAEPYSGDINNILDSNYDFLAELAGEEAIFKEYEPLELTTKEVVKLDCGVEALKFTGTMPTMDYHEADQGFYIHGYSFVYNNVTITMTGIIHEPDTIPEYKDMITDVVDRMVKTIRTEKE